MPIARRSHLTGTTGVALGLAACLTVLPAALLAQAATAAPATSPAALTAAADRVFAQWNSTHTPGCAVGVSRGGQVLLERGYGMADLAGERPITPSTILESGSVAKQFTAAAVMVLVADGVVKLEDDARKWLPELPTYDRPITVRHLLTHTSGLREWSNLVAWQGWPRGTRMHIQPDVFALITSQKVTNYPVGAHYSYTNSGFLLLRTLVERASKQTFSNFTRTRIFEPLGMKNSSWREDYTRIVPGLAQAYEPVGSGFRLDMPFDNIIAAGGMWTTVGDWLKWNEALTNKTLGSAVVDSMTQRMRLNNGLEIAYALGLTVGQYRGTPEIQHSGSTAGYSTFLARYPSLGNLSIAVMCNVAGAGATGYTRALVDALHPELPRAAAPDTITTDQSRLLEWRGYYEDTRWHTITRIDTVGGVMRQGATPLRALRDGSYLAGGQRMRFAMDADGKTRTTRFTTSDGDSVVWKWRADAPWRPTATELAAFEGRYRSGEIDATWTVSVRNGQLTMSPRAGLVRALVPTVRDAFDSPGEAVWFTRDRKGRVTAMHFGSARAWDFVFERLP
ncbi:MAG: serine hydrolase [Gemmatimonadaceae bacterium]|nr:serine hydrolase [Gemmatimonadaceae bacterium]